MNEPCEEQEIYSYWNYNTIEFLIELKQIKKVFKIT